MNKTLKIIVISGLIAAIFVSGGFALQIQNGYTAEGAVYQDVAPFRPIMPATGDPVERETFVNQGILDLQEKYPDAIGWLTIPHTGIDYPFVQTTDNSYYLHKDIDGKSAVAGTLFMDYQSHSDFSDFNTIIYGHHMKNETMFGPLLRFNNQDFFDTNRTGTIFLADKTFRIDFFAYLIVSVDDLTVYDSPTDNRAIAASLDYIRENARYYRDINVVPGDHIITLSTCAYEFQDARMLLIGELAQLQP